MLAMKMVNPVLLVMNKSCNHWFPKLWTYDLPSLRWRVSFEEEKNSIGTWNFSCSYSQFLSMEAIKKCFARDLPLSYSWAPEGTALIWFTSDLVGPEVRLLYVGKTAGYHSRTQEEIHKLLLSFADVGAIVVRLEGRNLLEFRRSEKEMDFLQQLRIESECFSGIIAASGIAAELGIPLAHRGVTNSVRFLTGHLKRGGTDPLFLMHHGLPPAVAVERGTTPQEHKVFAKLKDLADEIASVELVSPTLIIIGIET
ncbi:hypothetical protein FEM48_Zijuj10G0074500 [Ziziphus jujuba var. spinosa]|uniref:Uncharacterized protein n=1 Tax=Ziziphus jujuba var. spinosa TaxID=714518 RepID=A0A978UM38_ZIZJJ|nr:hypothetical protein FEM48_Zijuj10G0074500 [Ziziphus jujuba var. spinosa]